MVDHAVVSKQNIARMKKAYDAGQERVMYMYADPIAGVTDQKVRKDVWLLVHLGKGGTDGNGMGDKVVSKNDDL